MPNHDIGNGKLRIENGKVEIPPATYASGGMVRVENSLIKRCIEKKMFNLIFQNQKSFRLYV